ncbi:MAG: phosphate signaling complex protein PhoU [Clostridia bacterium]
MRNRFETELSELNLELVKMGSQIENAIDCAVLSLVNKDEEMADKAINIDLGIDKTERDIERHCLRLLLQQQPVARDLRQISTALKMITDMERIGDQASDIALLAKRIMKEPYLKTLEIIPIMANKTKEMVKSSVDAYVNSDEELAKAAILKDDEIDELFVTIRNELVELIIKDKNASDLAMDLLMIAKYFERIGDHAENIAEWVIFSITGVHKNHTII